MNPSNEPLNTRSVRSTNILNSPKINGSSDTDSIPYLIDLGLTIKAEEQPIKFYDNRNEFIHRWSSYVQGFSAAFVQKQLSKYKKIFKNPVILDPFAGCGTVLVQSKLNELESYGTELNPLLRFIADTKLNTWDLDTAEFANTYSTLPKEFYSSAPEFLKSADQFKPEVLRDLELLKGGIDGIKVSDEKSRKTKDLLMVAFSSILIDSSNLVRSPCLGYSKKKMVASQAPFLLMDQKINEIVSDLNVIKNNFPNASRTKSNVYLGNAKSYSHEKQFDLVITSPPYMNGLDYVINYKIEMGWLGFGSDHQTLKKIKDEMVVCDNVSKGLIKNFEKDEKSYTNDWIENIKSDISLNIERRGAYRRKDMPFIVHKYFDDMYQVMKNVVGSMKKDGRFILVVGDSLIADVYVPTDLLIAKIGVDLGLAIESIEKARSRRSGQIRSYQLRETIITLKK